MNIMQRAFVRRIAPIVRAAIWLIAIVWLARPATAASGCVVTVHPLATDAGIAALARGGNAIDAAVAAAFTLGVVDNHNSGIGGGCFILVRLANEKLVAIDGREAAPAKATRDMFLRDGKPQPELSQTGPLASGVPGALAAYDEAVRIYGRLTLRDLVTPAAAIAERGIVVDRSCAARLKEAAKTLACFPGSRAVLLRRDGSAYEEGDLLKQPDLARTYRAIGEHGIAWFYNGPIGRTVGQWMAANGGILTAEDFANYRVLRREPLVGSYRGLTIVGFPPPSSGGVHVIQILNMLERFDLKALHQRDPAQFYHVIAEAMKRAFADRAYWLGDPSFASVPRGLTDKSYAAQLARGIDPTRAVPVEAHGRPPRWAEDHFGKHTTHIAAVDGEGNWVALTTTINDAFGSKVIVPGTGVLLNNQMDDFAVAPGVPNSAGLLGVDANAVAPGKRPLSSMSPTIVLKDDRPILTLGAAGGPRIITQVVMALVCHFDLGLDLPKALQSPRIHHQWRPDRLSVESSLAPELVAALEKYGHKVSKSKSPGVTQAIGLTPDGNTWIGVYDPRVSGKAAVR